MERWLQSKLVRAPAWPLYAGDADLVRLNTLHIAQATGRDDGFVDRCLSEYDLDGWTVDHLVSSDVNLVTRHELTQG